MDEETGEKVKILGAEIAIVERDIKALKGHIAELEARLTRLLTEHWQLILTAKPADEPQPEKAQPEQPTRQAPRTPDERRALVVDTWAQVVKDNPRLSEKRIITLVAEQTGEARADVIALAFGEGLPQESATGPAVPDRREALPQTDEGHVRLLGSRYPRNRRGHT
jgi:hypothetical protein